MRSSTSTIVGSLTFPINRTSLILSIEWIASHLMKLRIDTPPSGGLISTYVGTPFPTFEIGITTTRSGSLIELVDRDDEGRPVARLLMSFGRIAQIDEPD